MITVKNFVSDDVHHATTRQKYFHTQRVCVEYTTAAGYMLTYNYVDLKSM